MLVSAAALLWAHGSAATAADQAGGAPFPTKGGRFAGKAGRTIPAAEWLDPVRQAPNGARYQTFTSKTLGREASYLVWLPPGYDAESRRYPVIYWLHGMGGTQRVGATMFVPQVEAAIKAGTLPPCLVVLVNGMVRSFYCDSTDGKVPMESVIIKDLVPHVDQTYRTIAAREGRVVEGYSMGGYGAAHLGFKYPKLFGTVVINAGALLDPYPRDIPRDGPMFGVFGEDRERRIAAHPLTLARQNAAKLRDQHVRIGCGSLDSLLPFNRELHELLQELGITHSYQIVPDVAHDATLYYRKLGPAAFQFHQRALESAGRAGPR